MSRLPIPQLDDRLTHGRKIPASCLTCLQGVIPSPTDLADGQSCAKLVIPTRTADDELQKAQKLSTTFAAFFESEKTGGMLLIICTVLSLAIANSTVGPSYLSFWQTAFAGLSVEHWVNDGLMAVFFLFVGLELERELKSGESGDQQHVLLRIRRSAVR